MPTPGQYVFEMDVEKYKEKKRLGKRDYEIAAEEYVALVTLTRWKKRHGLERIRVEKNYPRASV